MGSTPGHRGRAHLACLAIIVGLTVAWFFPLFQGSSYSAVPGYENAVYPWAASSNGQTFYPQSDQAALSLPWQTTLSNSLKHGSIPLWNNESFGGQPLFANGSSALAYPPRLILAKTVSPTTAYNVLSFLHVLLAGVFTYWLLADLELSPLAALFGAVAWMFGAYTLGWLELEVVAPLFAWLPAGLVTMRRAVLGSRRWVVPAAASIAMLLVSTHLLFADISAVVICLYGACLALALLVPKWRRTHSWRAFDAPAKAAGSAVLGIGLAAFVLVPTASVLSDISRQTLTFSQVTQGYNLTFADLRYALWPAPLPVTTAEMQWGLGFAGTITAVLAVIGLFLRRSGAGLGRGLAIGGLLVALGGPVGYVAFLVIPGLNVFHPYSRMLFVFDLGLAVLGAVGLDAVMRWIAGRQPATHESPPRHDGAGSGYTARWWISRGVAVVLIGVTAYQLGSYGRSINPPFLPTTAHYELRTTPLISALKGPNTGIAGWSNRVLPANYSTGPFESPMLDSDDPLIFGIDSANGYDSSVPTRTVDLWRVVAGEAPDEVVATKLDGAFDPTYNARITRFDLLPRLGVNQLALTPLAAAQSSVTNEIQSLGWKPTYSGPDGSLFTWSGAPTGPTVVFNSRHVASDAAALSAFTDPAFDYHHEVILQGTGTATAEPGGTFTIHSAHQGVNGAQVTVESSKAGWLVIPDMWDPGWTATVNGSSATVERANFNQQAVAVPAGTSTVVLTYRPVGLTKGMIISGTSVLVCVGLLAWPTRRSRRSMPEGTYRRYPAVEKIPEPV